MRIVPFDKGSSDMARWSVLALALLLATSGGYAQEAVSSDSDFVIKTDVRLVQLQLTVANRRGARVAGLTKDNFHVFDEGRPQPITYFQSENVPLTAGLVLDNSRSMLGKMTQVLAAAKELAGFSNSGDEMFVVHFSEQVTLPLATDEPFTDDVEVLLTAVKDVQLPGRTALFDGLTAAADHIRSGRNGKRALILISDGGDNLSSNTFKKALESVERSEAMVYAIGIYDEMSDDQDPSTLRRLARATGGRAYFLDSIDELPSIAAEIAQELRSQYTIGYAAPADPVDRYRKVRVQATDPQQSRKLVVRTRLGYYSGEISAPR